MKENQLFFNSKIWISKIPVGAKKVPSTATPAKVWVA